MAEKWIEAYENLRKFIAEHQEIKIDIGGTTTIAGDVRPVFYHYFSNVRNIFIGEYFAAELEKACELGKAYADISESVKQDMSLESIEVSGSLYGFLLNPLEGLMSTLYTPLFNLLRGKTNEESFAMEGKKAVEVYFKSLFCEGYKRWGVLSLLHLLRPSCLWDVNPDDLDVEQNRNAEFHPGMYAENVPELKQERRLAFIDPTKGSFVMPDVLVHSTHLNAYISLKTRWYEVRCKANSLNENLEWITLEQPDTKFVHIRPDLMLDTTIHLAQEDANELKLLADYNLVARPDMLIEFMEDDDWYDAKHIEHILLNNRVFTPRLGSYVISRVVVPPEAFLPIETTPTTNLKPVAETESATTIGDEPSETTIIENTKNFANTPPQKDHSLCLADLPENIHVISVGYDTDALEPVVQTIGQWLTLQEQPTDQQRESG